jgi:hypothetical protein
MSPKEKKEWEEYFREENERLKRLGELCSKAGQVPIPSAYKDKLPRLNKDGSLAGPEEGPEEGPPEAESEAEAAEE